jgi:type II secretory pathway pseudopilin PulG
MNIFGKDFGEKGFSLVSVMIAAGLVGVISVAVMSVFKNINSSQQTVQSIGDEAELETMVRYVLDTPKYCAISIADGQEFNKELVDFSNTEITGGTDFDSSSEGLDVSLFFSSADGTTRSRKILNGADVPDSNASDGVTESDMSTFRSLKINTVKLVFNTDAGCPNDDYCASSTDNDIAQLVVNYAKKVGDTTRDVNAVFNVRVEVETDASQKSKIISCSRHIPKSAGGPMTFFAYHSQSASTTPTCPGDDAQEMWTGFSLLTAGGGGGSSADQDLGSVGSCVKYHRGVTVVECENGGCDLETGDDYAHYLSGTTYNNTGENDATSITSRCVACAIPAQLLTVHSMTSTVPDCPSVPGGWVKLWEGYSFATMTGGGSRSAAQDLASPGSCLPVFRMMPFNECKTTSTSMKCEVTTGDDYAYYITAKTTNHGNVNNQAVLRSSYISRCSVCAMAY